MRAGGGGENGARGNQRERGQKGSGGACVSRHGWCGWGELGVSVALEREMAVSAKDGGER